MQKTYKLKDLYKLAESKSVPIHSTGRNWELLEQYRALQEQYHKKFGFYLDTWPIGPQTELINFILKYCLETGIPVEKTKLPPGVIQ